MAGASGSKPNRATSIAGSITPLRQQKTPATSSADTPSCVARRAVAEKALQAYRDAVGAQSDDAQDIGDLITDLMLLAERSKPAINPFRLAELAVSHFTVEASGDMTMPVRATLSVSARRRTGESDYETSWTLLHPQNSARKAKAR